MRSLAKTGLHAKSSPAFQGRSKLRCENRHSPPLPGGSTSSPTTATASRPFQSGVCPKKNPSVDFFLDRRFARQISGLLSRPSIGSLILFKYEKSHTLKKINFFYAFMSNSKLLPSIYYMEVKTNEIHKQKVQRFRLHRLVRK